MSGDPHEEINRWLVVLRHAKSAWPDVPDSERPLGKRGLRDAPRAGAWLREHGYVPERVLCSPARRTRQTWQLVAGELTTSPPVTYDPVVYDADTAALLQAIGDCPQRVTTLLLIGHCPSVQDVTLYLAGADSDADAVERVRTKFPTSGIAVLAIPSRWSDLAPSIGSLTDFAVARG